MPLILVVEKLHLLPTKAAIPSLRFKEKAFHHFIRGDSLLAKVVIITILPLLSIVVSETCKIWQKVDSIWCSGVPRYRHASTGNKQSSLDVFNRSLKLRQRESVSGPEDSDYYDYLRQESALRLTDRLDDINRTFRTALELGSYKNILSNVLASRPSLKSPTGGIGGVESLIEAKSDIILPNSDWPIALPTIKPSSSSSKSIINIVPFTCNEENLPFPTDSFDLVISNLNMHWVNDLPRALRQILNVLKPDGAFVASMLGGGTLKELKHCFYLADQERKGGLSPHASPMTLASDIAGLMQGANFALPTIDIDTVQISYPDAFSLMEHLYKMGEGHAAHNRHLAVGRDTMLAMAAMYQDQFGLEDGSVPATFEIIYLIGWKPHSSQPKLVVVVQLIIHSKTLANSLTNSISSCSVNTGL